MSNSDLTAGDRRRGSLVDLLDAGLDRGIAVRGEIVLSIAQIDLVTIDLRALLAGVDALSQPQAGSGTNGDSGE